MDIDKAKSLAQGYQPTTETVDLVKKTKLVLVVGTVASGKNTIIEHLFRSGQYSFIVSHTTREPRENNGVKEHDGEHYYFIDWKKAVEMLERREFVEAKINFGRNLYGTSAAEIQRIHDAQKIGITDVDIMGVGEYKRIASNIHAFFILPPSFNEWMTRLTLRGDLDQDDLFARLRTAEMELEKAIKDGYFHFIVNDDLEEAVKEVRSIILSSDEGEAKVSAKGVEKAWKLLGELKHHLSS